MKKNLLLLLFSLCFHVLFTQTASIDHVDGEIYVKFKKGALKAVYGENPDNIKLQRFGPLSGVLNAYGVTKATRPFYRAADDAILPDIVKLRFAQPQVAGELITVLEKMDGVEYAERIPLMRTTVTPNDFSASSASVHLTQIDAPNAWNVFNGNSNITVAIVDNGVMWTHVDLVANTYTNTGEIAGNGIDDDANGYVDDVNGYDVADNDNNPIPLSTGMFHGTHCAGTAGATNNNGTGVASIGWNIKLIPVKCEPDNGSAFGITYGLEGVLYAARAKARIISCSWGGAAYSAAAQAVVNYAWNRGSIVIFSAGNNNNNVISYPAAYNNSYAVAAVDPSDVKSSVSSYGSWVDISAPGDAIYSTMPYTTLPAYQVFSGTSEATPIVAGLAALMLSKSPLMTRSDVLNCISSTAQNIYTLSGNSAYTSGSQLGAGRINAYQAMLCAATFSARPPVANFYAFPLNACPNTPVAFTDSSLYAPTSWSWSFQGGTPATSTASNPSVQWSAPGTYSVLLTVTNASGSNAKTKLSYITIAAPGALPFSEGFQAAAFLPAGWTPNNIQNDEIYWERKTGVGGFGTSTACAMFDNYNYTAPGERDEMRTPRYNFTSVANARLRFDVAYARYDAFNSDSLQVKLSTNCGLTWTSIYLKGGATFTTAPDQGSLFVPAASQWRRDTIDIAGPAGGQGSVMFSFINRGHYGQPIYLDNINIVTPTPTLNVTLPASVCVGAAITLTNTSIGAASYTWIFAGAAAASSTATNPIVSYPGPGIFTISLTGTNGTVTAAITRTIHVYPYPTTSVSAVSLSICSGAAATVTAGGADTYSWSTGSTNSIISLSPPASTVYTVTGTNGGACSSTATLAVVVAASPTVTVNNATVCAGNTATLSASGAGSYAWSTGSGASSIVVNPAVSTSYTVTGSSGNCSHTAVSTVSVAANPVSVISVTNAACQGACSGIVNATTTAGSAFTYSLSGSACAALPCAGLCTGAYTLYVTDATGCKSTSLFSVSAPTVALQAAISVTNASCSSCADGALGAAVSGGVPAYTYTWLPTGGNGQVAANLATGCYTLAAGDAAGCITTATACIGFGTGLKNTAIATAPLLIYPNPASNMVTLSYAGVTFNYSVYNSLGQLVAQGNNIEQLTSIGLDGFAGGMYLLEIEAGKDKLYRKLMIE